MDESEAEAATLEQQTQQIASVRQIAQAIAQELTTQEIFQLAVHELVRVLRVNECCLFQTIPDSSFQGAIAIEEQVSLSVVSIEKSRLPSIASLYATHASTLAEGKTVVLPPSGEHNSPSALLITPLQDRQSLWGGIVLFAHQAWTTNDSAFVKLMASQCAIALQQERYHQQLRAEQHLRQQAEAEGQLLSTLIQSVTQAPDFHTALALTLQEVCQKTGWRYGEAWIPDEAIAALRCIAAWYDNEPALEAFYLLSREMTFSSGVGLPGRVWQLQHPEWDRDVSRQSETSFLRVNAAIQAKLRAALGIPILSNGSTLAVLVFFTQQASDENRRLIDLVSTVAVQLGAAFQCKQIEVALNELNQDLEDRVEARTNERQQVEEELRASLTEKNILLQEVHHRVKNNLQTISSLLRLQAGYVHDSKTLELLRDSQNRVQAMALIHEKLYQSNNLAQIDLQDYIHALSLNLLKSYTMGSRITLTVHVTDVELSIDTAISCGLIINELVSNALRHAFPYPHSGQVQVMLTAEETGTQVLTVQDNGIGLPSNLDLLTTKSLGLQLVHALTRQMRGSLEFKRKTGSVFTIRFSQLTSHL